MDVQTKIIVYLEDAYYNFAKALARNNYPCCQELEIAIVALFA